MIIQVPVAVIAPDDATHYTGDLLNDPTWYKVTQIGVVGDHWWYKKAGQDKWLLYGHSAPHFLKQIGGE
jgi:hypothetical protein